MPGVRLPVLADHHELGAARLVTAAQLSRAREPVATEGEIGYKDCADDTETPSQL